MSQFRGLIDFVGVFVDANDRLLKRAVQSGITTIQLHGNESPDRCMEVKNNFNLPITGLRFFTVYGPWGRPDMAVYLFCKLISEGKPISVFNQGDMQRDFTYIEDIVSGVIAALDALPFKADGEPPVWLYNIGTNTGGRLLGL